jgi:hypothetical protein
VLLKLSVFQVAEALLILMGDEINRMDGTNNIAVSTK